MEGIDKRWLIYRLYHKGTKKSYVGLTSDLAARRRSHEQKPPRKMRKDIVKSVREECEVSVLEKDLEEEEAVDREAHIIHLFNCAGAGGYNNLKRQGGKHFFGMMKWTRKKN